MARITQIRMRNVKGLSLDQSLTGLDLFVGQNGVGKSARLQTVAGAILGWIPGKNRLAGDTMTLASADEMTMGLSLDTGFAVDRTFKRTVRREPRTGREVTSVSMEITVSPSRGETRQDQKEARIAQEIGQLPAVFDFSAFTTLSDAEKRRFIYGLSPIASALTRAEVERRLREQLLTPELEVNNPEQYAIVEEFIVNALARYPEGYEVQAGLQSMLDWATAERKHWDDERKKSQAAAQALNEAKAKLQETDRDLAEKRGELEQIREERRRLAADIAANKERQRQAESRAARLAELETAIAALSKPVDNAEEISALTDHIAHEQASITEPDLSEYNRLAAEYERIQGEITSLLEERGKKLAELSRYQGEIARIDEYVKAVREFASKPKRVCVLDPAIGCPREDNFEKYFAARTEQRDKLQAKAAQVEGEIKDIDTRGADLKAAMVNTRTQMELARKAVQTTETANRAAQDRIRDLEAKLAEARQAEEKRQAQLAVARDEYDRLRLEPVAPYTDVAMLQTTDYGLSERELALSKEIQAKEEAARQLAQVKETLVFAKQATMKADAAKWLCDALGPKGILGLLVKEVRDSLAGEIQENLRLMGRTEQFFLRTEANGKEVFEFGWIGRNGIPVQFEDLSKGQKLLLTAAMVAAFLCRANPPVKVLAVDDIDGIHPGALPAVLSGLARLAGKVDNILLAGAILPPKTTETTEWNVVNLDEGVKQQCLKLGA